MNAALERYLARRGEAGPWRLEGLLPSLARGAVVIPALAEAAELPLTLATLAAQPASLRREFAVIVVVNQGEGTDGTVRADNLATLAWLRRQPLAAESPLAWIDAASPGRGLPPGTAGVGLARKLGCDLALPHLAGPEALLVHLDADTRVRPDYLPALVRHFEPGAAGGAVLPFCHRPAADLRQQAAIDRYELFLRHYLHGLIQAGSPYAFATVGSAMASTAAAYLKAGGMNRRRAAEDFYFLQQLAKVAGVAPLAGTVVYPSPRRSGRVPFGTGASMTRLLAGESGAARFYHPRVFALLGVWLTLVRTRSDDSAAGLLAAVHELQPAAAGFLESQGFGRVWERFRLLHRGVAARLAAFDVWFDALRTLRFVHHLSRELPRTEDPFVVAEQLALPGWESAALLARLRAQQGVFDKEIPCFAEVDALESVAVPMAAASRTARAPT